MLININYYELQLNMCNSCKSFFIFTIKTSNSSKPRIGQPIVSHNDKSKHIVENDFSPPDKDFGSFSYDSLPAAFTCA